ncbi:MAG: maleylpyruvate isomerase family mycothiol-dependent enzyme [Streptosporangiales bacterium]|nr:maleylpyruvate isomerase family mycothiol-dependent enzyme [Streptosporangiales bacterium]
MEQPDRTTITSALKEQYAAVTEVVEQLPDDTFMRGTGCPGWCVRDVLFHLLLDAQRGLVALATPARGSTDRDLVTYWQDFKPDTEDAAQAAKEHARFVRLSASAYRSPAALVRQWRETAGATARVAAEATQQPVATQGHTIASTDLIGTLAVEAAVHYLDLTKELSDVPPPSRRALSLVRHTLDGLAGVPAPDDWDDVTYALKGTGRMRLDAADRDALGDAADHYPLFG